MERKIHLRPGKKKIVDKVSENCFEVREKPIDFISLKRVTTVASLKVFVSVVMWWLSSVLENKGPDSVSTDEC